MNEGLFRHRLINTFRYNPGYMIAYYDVTSTSSKTKLLGDSFNNKKIITMYIDDVEVDVTSSYQFDTTGEHVVKLYLSPQTRSLLGMFANTKLKVLDVTNFNAEAIFDAQAMFSSASSLEEIINLENIDNMFYSCKSLNSIDVACFQNSPIDSCKQTFFSSDLFVQNLHLMNLTNVKSFNNTFCSIENEEITFEKPPIDVWNATMAFQACNAKSINLSNWIFTWSDVKLGSMFFNCKNLESIQLPNNIQVASVESIFEGCENLEQVPEFFLNIKVPKSLDMGCAFQGCTKLINADFSNWNIFTDVTYTISLAFENCLNLETVLLPHGKLRMTSTASEGRVFYNCKKLKEIDLSNNIFDVSLAPSCFYGCESLENITWGNCWYSGNTKSTAYCFYDCFKLKTLDLSTWTVDNIQDMDYMFANCSCLESINTSGWDTSNVIRMDHIFGSTSVTNPYITSLDISHWNLENVLILNLGFTLFENLNEIKVQTALHKDLYITALVSPNTSGTLYYDVLLSDCYEIISKLPPSWNAISVSEIIDCTSLAITADNVLGNEYTTTIYYEAIVNGIKQDGTVFTGISISDSRESMPFGKNKSETDSVIKTISFNLFGKNATTTITQSPLINNSIFCTYFCYKESTKILHNTRGVLKKFDYILVDGEQKEAVTYYSFETFGKHKILFHLANSITDLEDTFFQSCLHTCDLSDVDLSNFNYSAYFGPFQDMFYSCPYLTSVIFPESVKEFKYAIDDANNLSTLVIKKFNAPATSSYTFGSTNSGYVGDIYKNFNINKLYVPFGSSGYDSGYWTTLYDVNYCGFTKEYIYIPSECTSLSITAENVSGIWPYTTIHYEAVTKGFDIIDGYVENVVITGTAISDSFGQNTSETESVVKEVSFTYMGVTATTTIIQGVYKQCEVILNDQWRLSTNVANPNTSSFDGVYESFSNYHVAKGMATMYIDIDGYTNFRLYIRSYANTYYDYVMVSHLDKEITTETNNTNTSVVKSHTRDAQSSGTDISNYKLVEFTEIEPGPHRITIVYRKFGSTNQGTDRGYVLIPKNQ